MVRRRKYTREFKESAVELYRSRSSEKTAAEIAEELGISSDNLYRWLRETEAGEKDNLKIFPGQGIPRNEELSRLRKEVADLRETNEILKKALAIFTIRTPR
jgi:transposase